MSRANDNQATLQSSWAAPAVVLMVALFVRGAVLCCVPQGLDSDIDGYRQIAENLRHSGVFGWKTSNQANGAIRATAFRPPLYPIVLASVVRGGQLSSEAVGWLHWALGAATVGLVFALSTAWGLRRWASVAAVLVACDPILLQQSTQVMTETLATLVGVVALVSLTWLHRRDKVRFAALAGAALGLTVLCRPTFLVWLGLCLLVVLLHPSFRSRRANKATVLVVSAAVVLVPWGLRNYGQFGRFRLTTTHGGYTLLLGNNPSFYRFLAQGESGRTWDSVELDEAWRRRYLAPDPRHEWWSELAIRDQPLGLADTLAARHSELDDDRFAYGLAQRFMREQAGMFVWSCWVRVGRIWGIVPHQLASQESPNLRLARYASGVWYAVLFLLASAGIYALRGRFFHPPWLWGVLLCLAFTGVHGLYWSNIRMRAPLMPFVCLLATVGIAWIASRRGICKELFENDLRHEL